MNEEIIVTTSESKLEELRIESYMPHCWFRVPKNLRDRFDTVRKGIFEISPPCFEHEEIEGKSLSFTFKWGCDLNNVDSPLNENGISEHVWVKSIRGLKYLHPSRAFNKILRHKYQGLWETQHFSHKWNDNGDVISLTISWDLDQYTPPKSEEVD